VANIPFARSLNPYTHTDWEGTGVRPDVAVPSSQALEKAQQVYLAQKLGEVVGEQDKRRVQWLLDKLRAENNREGVKPEILSKYTAVYDGGLDFYVDQGRFFCKNAERGNAVFELKAVSDTLFVLDENVIVEFLKGENGNYSALAMHWSDGDISTKKRK
jgi:hypothetical protein